MIAVKATQDDSGHWYLVPNELMDEFHMLCFDEEHEYEFMEKFDRYRTGGDLNLVQLYIDECND